MQDHQRNIPCTSSWPRARMAPQPPLPNFNVLDPNAYYLHNCHPIPPSNSIPDYVSSMEIQNQNRFVQESYTYFPVLNACPLTILRPYPFPPPMQAMRGNNSNLRPQVLPSSSYRHRVVNNPRQHDTSRSFQGRSGDSNRNVRPSMPIDQMANQNNLPLEEDIIRFTTFEHTYEIEIVDDVIILEGDSNSDGSNFDDMPYEFLLELEEEMGHVKTGLSEETILSHLKTRTLISSKNQLNLNEAPSLGQEPEICVICQVEDKNHEEIGTLQCGHDYHAECIKKWLQENNVCPVCKATALIPKS